MEVVVEVIIVEVVVGVHLMHTAQVGTPSAHT